MGDMDSSNGDSGANGDSSDYDDNVCGKFKVVLMVELLVVVKRERAIRWVLKISSDTGERVKRRQEIATAYSPYYARLYLPVAIATVGNLHELLAHI
ncbi:hypothetical protein NDU88_000905 [Pleurodeles waltl]|uniref:Uncharacterized protein n=1 Tax=Pleurodeles waltl TaxID=8319 RepID=A0AAV7LZG4_PLEWA|nr:hypothetical protein NDU88_000905 [Pleurodeles waltl]